jgi:hypothetical protein
VYTQVEQRPTNDAPNPYKTTEKWGKLPAGRTWGALNAVGIDRDGESVWVADRCGSNPERPPAASAFAYDSCGQLDAGGRSSSSMPPETWCVASVRECSCFHTRSTWIRTVTSGSRISEAPTSGAREVSESKNKGHIVVKFSPEGKVLLTIGKAGTLESAGGVDRADQHRMAPNGNVYVSEGHQQGDNAAPTTVSTDLGVHEGWEVPEVHW